MVDDDFDFGFSSVSEEEVKSEGNTKAERMYNAIMPLLKNLLKDADTNPYIHWPNRKEKITQFIQKLDNIKE